MKALRPSLTAAALYRLKSIVTIKAIRSYEKEVRSRYGSGVLSQDMTFKDDKRQRSAQYGVVGGLSVAQSMLLADKVLYPERLESLLLCPFANSNRHFVDIDEQA